MHKIFIKLIAFVSLVTVSAATPGEYEQEDQVQGVHFLQDWSMAGATKVQARNPITDLVGYQDWETIIGEVPAKCQTHLKKETDDLKTVEYNAHKWMAHVAECPCCGPVLAGIFAAHVNNVAKLSHTVVFFDFDSAILTPDNREQIRRFVSSNYKQNQRYLLIARASRTIPVKHGLDYLRDHSTYNLQLSERRALAVRAFISTQLFDQEPAPDKLYDLIPIRMFGMADPQIDPRYVHKYNIEQAQWRKRYFKGKDPIGVYRLNQSVVVIAFDGDLREDFHAITQESRKNSFPSTGGR